MWRRGQDRQRRRTGEEFHPQGQRRTPGSSSWGTPPARAGLSLTAATALDLPFIGYARTRQIARQLRRADCEHTVASLKPLYQAPLPS
ncbi:hypothetical protein [Streptomyces tailanensis]|uniref:hypothetical protein n=1 Tax=Streptomyces tailanensis TaxID=2569858 RepID=UPI00122DD116|nr:hypothetical protein [Streptomyces tailanensis]